VDSIRAQSAASLWIGLLARCRHTTLLSAASNRLSSFLLHSFAVSNICVRFSLLLARMACSPLHHSDAAYCALAPHLHRSEAQTTHRHDCHLDRHDHHGLDADGAGEEEHR
jgi:hypothetical protein